MHDEVFGHIWNSKYLIRVGIIDLNEARRVQHTVVWRSMLFVITHN